jgi:WD40 repeat protein
MDPIEEDMSEAIKVWRVLPGYAWTHDSKSIVVASGGGIHRVWLDGGKVDTISFTAHVHRTLSEMAYVNRRASGDSFEAHAIRWHTASPDGKTLAFQAVGHVWLMDLPNGMPRRLTPPDFDHYEYSPAWSPDGKWVAFTTWDEKDGGYLWKSPPAGGAPQNLTTQAGEYINPSWSADGSELVLARGSGATLRGRTWSNNIWYDVVRVPASGGELPAANRQIGAPGLRFVGELLHSDSEWRSLRPVLFRRYRLSEKAGSIRPDGTWELV